eukprot:TRINITY_DN897_c0_g2_i1.p1 TRINITY_DN897_c0_g2~~TRINITY_DN897_c0_g2_i1.p1  ORF type:complete len:400 (+),score=46.87 TRINITY_DN897_c0_g2_i1:177-1376(+)
MQLALNCTDLPGRFLCVRHWGSFVHSSSHVAAVCIRIYLALYLDLERYPIRCLPLNFSARHPSVPDFWHGDSKSDLDCASGKGRVDKKYVVFDRVKRDRMKAVLSILVLGLIFSCVLAFDCPACRTVIAQKACSNAAPGSSMPTDIPCQTAGSGACSAGTLSCSSGSFVCHQTHQPSAEICNDNIDNDCDGQVDEGCSGSGPSDPPPCQSVFGSSCTAVDSFADDFTTPDSCWFNPFGGSYQSGQFCATAQAPLIHYVAPSSIQSQAIIQFDFKASTTEGFEAWAAVVEYSSCNIGRVLLAGVEGGNNPHTLQIKVAPTQAGPGPVFATSSDSFIMTVPTTYHIVASFNADAEEVTVTMSVGNSVIAAVAVTVPGLQWGAAGMIVGRQGGTCADNFAFN